MKNNQELQRGRQNAVKWEPKLDEAKIWVRAENELVSYTSEKNVTLKKTVASNNAVLYSDEVESLTYQVKASIVGYHISYTLAYPESLKYYGVVLYALATIGPPFFSHIKRMWLLGATILISYVVTMIFYDYYILSVWCFFSSIISLSIYAIVLKSRVKKI